MGEFVTVGCQAGPSTLCIPLIVWSSGASVPSQWEENHYYLDTAILGTTSYLGFFVCPSSTNCGKNIVWRQVAAKNNNLQILYQFLCIFLFLHATSVCNATDSAGWDFQLQPSQQPHIKKQTSNHSFKWAKATNNITGMFPHLIKASFDSGWFDRW